MSEQLNSDFNNISNMNPTLPFYRGEVLKCLPRGRCKIFIPGLYPNEFRDSPEKLPDAEQATPIFGGSISGNGIFSYPSVGTIVWCFLENNDQNYPIYFAFSQGGDASSTKFVDVFPKKDSEGNQEVPNNHVFNVGNTYITFDRNGEIRIGTWSNTPDCNIANDSYIRISKDGHIQIIGGKCINIEAPSIKIKARDQFHLNSGSIRIGQAGEIGTLSFYCNQMMINCKKNLNVRTECYPRGVNFYGG